MSELKKIIEERRSANNFIEGEEFQRKISMKYLNF